MEKTTGQGSWTGQRVRVQDDWMDINRHMNMKYYFRVLEDATREVVWPDLRQPDADELELWIDDAMMSYRKELFAGQKVFAEVYPIGHDHERIDFFGRVVFADEPEVVSAECFFSGRARDSRGFAPLSEETKRAFAARLAETPHTFKKPHFPPLFEFPDDEDKWFLSAEDSVPRAAETLDLAEHLDIFEKGASGMFRELARFGNVDSGTIKLWYRVAENGEGRPANTPDPSCTTGESLPCMIR